MKQPVSSSQCDLDLHGTFVTQLGRYSELHDAVFADGAFASWGLPTNDLSAFRKATVEPICSIGPNWSTKKVSQAASLFLFRKCLPSPKPALDGWFEKLARDSPLIDMSFAYRAREVIKRFFPKGWDRRYGAYVREAVVSGGACTEVSEKEGGAREYIRREYGEEAWIRKASSGLGLPKLNPNRKVVQVDDGGKWRTVTVASGDQHFLAPLHHILYDHLVSQGGVLRGDANPKSMSSMCRDGVEKEEVFVSGDYESATDNFNVSHSKLLLRLLRKQSDYIPEGIWDMAADSLTGFLIDPVSGELRLQLSGQMMGNYLSFPLLCLTNLLTVALAFGADRMFELIGAGLLKVNGDDIIFRCRRDEVELWFDAVARCGLKLSKGKTLIHKRFWSLNSTFFRAGVNQLSLVPVIRSKAAFGIRDYRETLDMVSLESVLDASLKGFHGKGLMMGKAIILRRFRYVLLGRGGKRRNVVWGPFASLTTFWRKYPWVVTLGKADRHLLKRELEILNPLWQKLETFWRPGPGGSGEKARDQVDISRMGLGMYRTDNPLPAYAEKAVGSLVSKTFREATWKVSRKEVESQGDVKSFITYRKPHIPSLVRVIRDKGFDVLGPSLPFSWWDSLVVLQTTAEGKSSGSKLAADYEYLARQRSQVERLVSERFASRSVWKDWKGVRRPRHKYLVPEWYGEAQRKGSSKHHEPVFYSGHSLESLKDDPSLAMGFCAGCGAAKLLKAPCPWPGCSLKL